MPAKIQRIFLLWRPWRNGIATLALLGLDVAPEIEAYRLRLLSHRSQMELHDAQDVVTYKTVCHNLKMLEKYRPGTKS